MLKHYYRLVYWRRRLTRATRAPVRRPRGRSHSRDLLRTDRIRPFLVFAVIVLIAITASYALGLRATAGTGTW